MNFTKKASRMGHLSSICNFKETFHEYSTCRHDLTDRMLAERLCAKFDQTFASISEKNNTMSVNISLYSSLMWVKHEPSGAFRSLKE